MAWVEKITSRLSEISFESDHVCQFKHKDKKLIKKLLESKTSTKIVAADWTSSVLGYQREKTVKMERVSHTGRD